MISDELAHKFRTTALERIERVEHAWEQVLSTLDDDASRVIQREIHTLKGESQFVGESDVNVVCHKLEDLLDVARARGYAVDDDFDLAVTIALRFMVTLVKKRASTAIDLPGFLRQLELVLKRHEHTGRSRSGSVPPALRATSLVRLGGTLRATLGPAAVDAFIEYAVARGPRRDRLRASWHLLRDLVGIQRAVISAEQLHKYRASVTAMALELGKQVDVRLEVETAEVTGEVLAALDVATLHLVRNALDHGIELPAVRAAAGKPLVGRIVLRARRDADRYILSVEDDGAGVDFDRVRARGVELGLLAPTSRADEARLVDLMCHPGFSTRTAASDVSGRGVGLDAVRGAAIDVGGTVFASSRAGVGTTWSVSVPIAPLTVPGYAIRAPGLRFPVVLGAPWKLMPRPAVSVIVDLGVALGLSPSNSISATVWGFTNGAVDVGVMCGGKPQHVQARALVATSPSAIGEVVAVDAIEGLLLRPERIPGVLG
ncbi:MAG TPA: ATP-binding protein [Kofleriaceae bacterium]|nr:ATP-binding protein [Kofleriaceae bacterium]